mgnify:CR=1 FL=1
MDKSEMRILETSISRLAMLLLPSRLRQPAFAAIIMFLTAPISQALKALREWRAATIARLGYNGQVCNLERALNDMLDPEQRAISIIDGQQRRGKPYYVYQRGTSYISMPLGRGMVPAILIESREAITATRYDFEVAIPPRITDQRRLKTLVNLLKLPSKTWRITASI